MSGAMWSYVLTASGALVMWLAASPKRHLTAWTLGLLNQILWGSYAFSTGQYGFVFGCLLYGTVYARNWRKAWALRTPAPERCMWPYASCVCGNGIGCVNVPVECW